MDGKELVKQTLDQIPQADSNAKRIVGLVKESGRITGYQLSDNSIVEKIAGGRSGKAGPDLPVCLSQRMVRSTPRTTHPSLPTAPSSSLLSCSALLAFCLQPFRILCTP